MKFVLWRGKAIMQTAGKKYFGDFYVTGKSLYFEGKNGLNHEIEMNSIEKLEVVGTISKKLKVICRGRDSYVFILKNVHNVKDLIDSVMKNYHLF